ncbi:hypothetical protein ACFQYP_24130 [Nonomuraea antimicrobica]
MGKPVPELVALFRSIVAEGREIHPMASDFLEHFMDGAAPRGRCRCAGCARSR